MLPINSKDQLAKLLATENVTVQHSVQANTASFDLKNRVLTLPILKYRDGDVVDMMQGHEVGHALYTDEVKWMAALTEEGVHKQILNVVEAVSYTHLTLPPICSV